MQTKYCGVNWGNGFITDANLVNSYSISSPTSFFQELLTKPYLSQVPPCTTSIRLLLRFSFGV